MEPTLSPETCRSVVALIIELIEDNYVLVEKAQEITNSLQTKLAGGGYDALADVHTLARAVTADLQAVSKDRHLRVWHDPEQAADIEHRKERDRPSDDETRRWMAHLRHENFGFAKVERLIGNVGYLDLRNFVESELGGETAVAAMSFLANSNAIIFDLRRNGGGSPTMIQLLTSYLYDTEPQHLNTFHFRPTDSYRQFWTFPYVPGRRMRDVPVYVLTSSYTFSAAEEFTYNLKHMGRATVVGETTAGGAHPVQRHSAAEGFVITIPFGRAINPITDANWEGTGVEPHIVVPQAQALQTAHLHALETIIENCTDDDYLSRLRWDLETVRATYTPADVDKETLSRYVGRYADRTISLIDCVLTHEFMGLGERLLPITESRFALSRLEQVEFVTGQGGTVTHLVVANFRGQRMTIPKTQSDTRS
jgi:hypothetical protein